MNDILFKFKSRKEIYQIFNRKRTNCYYSDQSSVAWIKQMDILLSKPIPHIYNEKCAKLVTGLVDVIVIDIGFTYSITREMITYYE